MGSWTVWEGGEAAGGGSVAVVVLVLSQNKVLQRFAEQILDDKVVDRAQQRFEEQDLEVPPRLLLCSLAWVWCRRCPAWRSCSCSRTETCTLFLRAPLLAETRPLFPTVFRTFGRISLVFPFEGVLRSRGRFAVALKNLDFQRAPCV